MAKRSSAGQANGTKAPNGHGAAAAVLGGSAPPKEFSRKRLPDVEGMSAQQHALITLINAACHVTDEESKQVLFCKTLRTCRNKDH